MSRRNRRLLFFGSLLALTAYNLHRLVQSTATRDSHTLKFERKLISDPAAESVTQGSVASARGAGSSQSTADAAAGMRADTGVRAQAGGGAAAVKPDVQKSHELTDLVHNSEAASGAFATGA
jgi:hypothetical protein